MATKSSFSAMRKQSSNLEALQNKIKSKGKKDYSDDRYWKAQQDKSGSASAVIRFLPAPVGEEDSWVELYSMGFKGADALPNNKSNGQWFIENCPSTIGLPSPVLEDNTRLWETGDEDNKTLVRKRKRKKAYIANVLVVKDPANPHNEGKVFLFKFGVKVYEKLEAAMFPKFEDDAPINVFDPWAGANFKLRIAKKDGFANYDSSVFEGVSTISDDDAVIEEIWNAQHPLAPIIAPDQFKSYDDLKAKFERIVGKVSTSQTIEEDLNYPTAGDTDKSADHLKSMLDEDAVADKESLQNLVKDGEGSSSLVDQFAGYVE